MGALFNRLDNFVHVGKIQFRIDALAVEVHGHGNHIHIARALTIAHKGALDPVSTGHHTQLSCSDSTTPVIVGVQGNQQTLTPGHIVAEPLDLIGIDIGGTHLNGRREIDNHPIFGSGLPNGSDRVTDLNCEIQLRSSEALGGVFEYPFSFGVPLGALLHQLCTIDRNIHNALAIQPKDLLALHGRSGVVDVHYRPTGALQGLKGLLDQLLARLNQHLNGHIFRNPVIVYEFANKVVVMAGSGGKTHFNFLETHLDQLIPEQGFLLGRHGLDQSLVAIAQVDAAPQGRPVDKLVWPAAISFSNRLESLVLAVIEIAHDFTGVIFIGRLFTRGSGPSWGAIRLHASLGKCCPAFFHGWLSAWCKV